MANRLGSPLTPANDPSNLGGGGLHEDIPTLARLRKEFAARRQATDDRDVHPKTSSRRTQK